MIENFSSTAALLLGAAAVGALIASVWRARVHARKLAQALALQQAAWREEMQQQAHAHALALQAKSLALEALQTRATQLLAEREQGVAQRDQYQARLSDSETQLAALRSKTDQERQGLTEQIALLHSARADLTREFELLATRIFEAKQAQFSSSSQTLLDHTLSPFKQQLQDFRQKVEDVYERENAQRNRLSGQVQELQRQAQKIGEDAINLARALKGNTKAQGNWGELVLERVLEESGLRKGVEYSTQVQHQNADGNRLIPDVIVHLPEARDIVVDAKCSLVAYERYCSSEDDTERGQFLQAHVQSLRQHLKNLSGKDYQRLTGVRTLDFVFIFIPIEQAFMAALQAAPELYREAYERHIILVSPTTLLATLRTVENIWRYEKQNKHAQKIAEDAGALHDQLVLVVESLSEVERLAQRTFDACKKTQERLSSGRGNVIKQVDKLRLLGAKTKRSFTPVQRDAAGIDAEDSGEIFADDE